ncbi:hypothetical protein LXL04_037414 [Taraxacum kok-saghyz]
MATHSKSIFDFTIQLISHGDPLQIHLRSHSQAVNLSKPAPVNEVFDFFDFEPIAVASLGQVHRVKLKGQELVVKVQRPGLKDLFDIDLKNLRKLDPKSDGAKRDWVAIYDECANVLYQEIDYTKEAANASCLQIISKILIMLKSPQFIGNSPLHMLSRYAVESYLEQILSHGFFHADPHPGNIAVE